MSTKKNKRIPYSKLKRGMVVREVIPAYVSDWTGPVPEEVCSADEFVVDPDEFCGEEFEVVGEFKIVKLPDADEDYAEAILFNGKLHIGCQTIDAVKAFKNLGKALGYEVTG